VGDLIVDFKPGSYRNRRSIPFAALALTSPWFDAL
jgi:hypothetical protein